MSFECDTRTLARLEWPRLAERLAAEAATRRGAEACRGEIFQATRAAVRERLEETSEARRLLDGGEEIPFGGVCDLRSSLGALGRAAALSARDFADIRLTLRGSARIAGLMESRASDCPRLAALARTLPDLSSLERELARVVSEEGEVLGDASSTLRKARAQLRQLEREIERHMATYLGNSSIQPHLQDRYVTFRENRPVLPVRADARHRVRGIVHDVSSSGSTVFIEPEGVVETGNALRLAQTEIEREVQRLLAELGRAVSERSLEIEALTSTLGAIDLAMARGRLSRRLGACAPDLREDARLDLRALRHPLLLLEAGLSEEEVIANDIALPPDARCLVISGPNAGGKTVVAKAVGLAALAVRAGMHVPCVEGSEMPIFQAVRADIGDEQDLRAGLSTFSARMANLAGIVAAAEADTLVIVDEVGEGTEPSEGASLAQAILEALVARDATVLVTTHFNSLKGLAAADSRFVNASAEFDPETLLPTYRIEIGAPGSSGARWVASRMGLDASVVQRAEELLGSEDRELEELAQNVADLRNELDAERRLAQQARAEAEKLRSTYAERLESLRLEREKTLAEMKADLAQEYTDARIQIAAVVRALQRGEGGPGRAANRAYQKLEGIRENVEAVEREHAESSPASGEQTRVAPEELVPGARLEVEGLPGSAVVVEGPDRRQRIAVRVGAARMSIPSDRVRRVLAGPEARASGGSANLASSPTEADEDAPGRECDLRGLRVDEALDRADAYLQHMLGRGEPRLLLIHGHGTGALRTALRAWLRELPQVADFGPAEPGEGGNGVTFVRLTH